MMKPLTGAVLIASALASQAMGAEPSTYTVVTAPFMVGVVRENGTKANATLGAYLDVRERDEITAICRWMPVVRDAVTRALSRHPLRVVESRIDLTGTDVAVRDAINDALKTDLVTAVRMFHSGATGAAADAAEQAPEAGTLRACSAEGKAQAGKATKPRREVGDVFERKDAPR